MDSLAQTAQPISGVLPQRRRGVGWLSIASGVALIIVGEAPYFPSSFGVILLIAILVFLLGMVPAARWISGSVAARRAESGARLIRVAAAVGIAGMLIAAATSILALPHWLSAVPAQIVSTSALGLIGAWLLVANVMAFRLQLFNRVLAAPGTLAGLGWLLGAVIMWLELAAGNLGSLTATLELLRVLGGYVGEAFYLIWAIWLGIWLLVRKR